MPDGGLSQGAGEEGFSHPGGPGHEHVAMGLDPVALRE